MGQEDQEKFSPLTAALAVSLVVGVPHLLMAHCERLFALLPQGRDTLQGQHNTLRM